MASLSRRDPEFDADLWADLAARVLGVVAAFGLAALGLVLLFPAVGSGHLPALPLGPAEAQRPLVGLLCFALSGIVGTAVMLFKTPDPPIARPAPAPREMNFAPASPAEAPELAPFPVAQVWRAPPPPLSDPAALGLSATPWLDPPPQEGEVVTPVPALESVSVQAPPEMAALEVPAPHEAIAPEAPAIVQPDTADSAYEFEPAAIELAALETPAPEAVVAPDIHETAPLEIGEPDPQPEATAALAPEVGMDPAQMLETDSEPVPAPVEDDFDTRRQRLKATLGEASAIAAALSAEAADDHQHALAAQDVGDVALASGAPDRAADAYDRALLHARALMEAHPDATAVRTVLAEVLTKIGDLNTAKGRMGAALGAYEEAIVHRREAARLGGADAARLDLAAALENLAKLRQTRGETAKARVLYAESLEHLGPLAQADPRHGDMAYRAKLSLLALDSPA